MGDDTLTATDANGGAQPRGQAPPVSPGGTSQYQPRKPEVHLAERRRQVDLARLKDWASIAQAMAATVAVLLGGIWTWRVFSVTHQRDVAELQLAKVQTETHEALKKAQPIFHVTCSLKAHVLAGTRGERFVQVDAVLTNIGSVLGKLDLSEVEFMLTRIDNILANGEYVYRRPSRHLQFQSVGDTKPGNVAVAGPASVDSPIQHRVLTGVQLKPDAQETLSAVQIVDAAGLYDISFGIKNDVGQITNMTSADTLLFVP